PHPTPGFPSSPTRRHRNEFLRAQAVDHSQNLALGSRSGRKAQRAIQCRDLPASPRANLLGSGVTRYSRAYPRSSAVSCSGHRPRQQHNAPAQANDFVVTPHARAGSWPTEELMRRPSIAELMILIALRAANFAILRFLLSASRGGQNWHYQWPAGFVPLAD